MSGPLFRHYGLKHGEPVSIKEHSILDVIAPSVCRFCDILPIKNPLLSRLRKTSYFFGTAAKLVFSGNAPSICM